MTIRICREFSLFNFERLDILCPRIGHPCEKLWPFEFLESFRCSISSVSIYYVPVSDISVKFYDHSKFSRASVVQLKVSRYMMHVNQTSEWTIIAIWISRELQFNFERHDISLASIIHSTQKVSPFEFAESFRGQFQGSRYMMHVNRTTKWKVIAIWIFRELPWFNF